MKVSCVDPKEGEVEHTVWPFRFTKEHTMRLYEESSKFPVLFGRRLKDMKDFIDFFFCQNLSDDIEPQGLVWIVDDFRGMFYLNNIRDIEADVHYSFFDRRHKGRAPLVRAMMKDVFAQHGFVRLNAYVPAYAGMGVRKFIEDAGFRLEGRKRKNAWWKGEWFDTYLYGILREDLTDGSATS